VIKFRYLAAAFLGSLLLLAAAMVWRPFRIHAVSYQTGSKNAKVAGEIVRGFDLEQTIPANVYTPSRKRRLSIHWHHPDSLGKWTTPNCFSIRFASYSRKNRGELRVGWRQGSASQEWPIDAAAVRNAFMEFCASAGLEVKAPFLVTVRGLKGKMGSAPTVWLAKSALPPAQVNGKSAGPRGLNMQLTYVQHVGPRTILGVTRGAFALGCACSLGFGLIALVAIRRKAFATKDKQTPWE
jgi:hypothetical protein